eukprot:2936925-Pyramimonas_sp.AAC.1
MTTNAVLCNSYDGERLLFNSGALGGGFLKLPRCGNMWKQNIGRWRPPFAAELSLRTSLNFMNRSFRRTQG